MPNEIIYAVGDATVPMNSGPGIIAHICNDIGGWGKGFVQPLGRRYPEAEKQYRQWFKRQEPPFALGQVQFVEVGPELWVANMIAQHGIGRQGPMPPIRYEVLRECLSHVRAFAQAQSAFVQMPRIGCGLAAANGKKSARLWKKSLSCTISLHWCWTCRWRKIDAPVCKQ